MSNVCLITRDGGEPQPLHQMLTLNSGCCFNYTGRRGLTPSARGLFEAVLQRAEYISVMPADMKFCFSQELLHRFS